MGGDRMPDAVNPVETIAAAKSDARARAFSARAALDRQVREAASAAAAEILVVLPELAQAHRVLSYFALPAEIDPLGAVSALRERGVAVAYPRVESPGILGTYLVDDERDLVPGPFGLMQPGPESVSVALELIDAVIIPGVAFDERGMRLGYGGGYYDRLLPRLRPDCLRLGLAFEEQLLAKIPAEPHDAIVDLIATQTRVIRP
jgi:5-formyltetrahydrofolate cyclo-ligase